MAITARRPQDATATRQQDDLDSPDAWPDLPLDAWQDTYDTLHMWTQIVGKIRMELSPPVNHWWHVTLYVTPEGLTTGPIPHDKRIFSMTFDFVHHTLGIVDNDGAQEAVPLKPMPVAEFYAKVMDALSDMGIAMRINTMPQEFPNPMRFDEDLAHKSYNPEYVNRWWRIMVSADAVLKEFRSRFIGKCSPVHFFWGSFDLAVTRFSGRPAPERKDADAVTREAYSHEVSSAGFWPGSGPINYPAFYSYMAPEPEGFKNAKVRPSAAFYSKEFSNFILPYDEVRRAASPSRTLMEFLQSTYQAGADLARWDRAALERR
jgi:hypothetical protein